MSEDAQFAALFGEKRSPGQSELERARQLSHSPTSIDASFYSLERDDRLTVFNALPGLSELSDELLILMAADGFGPGEGTDELVGAAARYDQSVSDLLCEFGDDDENWACDIDRPEAMRAFVAWERPHLFEQLFGPNTAS